MDIIFAHSDDFIAAVFAEWLDVVDVMYLNWACDASKDSRENLHRILTAKQVVLHNNAERHYFLTGDNALFNWLSRTKIKMKKLVITPEMAGEAMELVVEYVTLCGPALQSLRCIYYDRQIMSAVTNYCLRVKSLWIDSGAEIEEGDILFSESMETLYLSNNYYPMNNDICIKLPNLRDLSLVKMILDDTLIGIVQHTPMLRRLALRDTLDLTVSSFAAIGQYCRSLECLSLYAMPCPSTSLALILPFTPRLIKLELLYMHGELNVKGVFEALATYCPMLATLTLADNESAPHPAILQALVQMLTRCVHLRTLNLQICRFVTDDFLFAIASKATHITHLDLYECYVSNSGLTEIALHCTELAFICFCTGDEFETTDDCRELFRNETCVKVIHNMYDEINNASSDEDSQIYDDSTTSENDVGEEDASEIVDAE